MDYRRSVPRKAWTCYFEEQAEEKTKKLQNMFPMVQFVLDGYEKLIISYTGEKNIDENVQKLAINLGGIIV